MQGLQGIQPIQPNFFHIRDHPHTMSFDREQTYLAKDPIRSDDEWIIRV